MAFIVLLFMVSVIDSTAAFTLKVLSVAFVVSDWFVKNPDCIANADRRIAMIISSAIRPRFSPVVNRPFI